MRPPSVGDSHPPELTEAAALASRIFGPDFIDDDLEVLPDLSDVDSSDIDSSEVNSFDSSKEESPEARQNHPTIQFSLFTRTSSSMLLETFSEEGFSQN